MQSRNQYIKESDPKEFEPYFEKFAEAYFEDSVLYLLRRIDPNTQNGKDYILSQKIANTSFRPDAYISDASNFFEDGGDCFVEIKTQLRSDTLYRLLAHYKEMINKSACRHLLLVYRDALVEKSYLKSIPIRYKRTLKVISFEKLYKIYKSVGDESPASKSQEESSGADSSRIDIAINAFQKGHVTLFLGAGVGKSANMPDWKELLDSILSSSAIQGEVGTAPEYDELEKDCSYSCPVVGRFAVNSLVDDKDFDSASKKYGKAIEELRKKIKKKLYATSHSSDLVNVLAELTQSPNVDSVITYNYDDLLEQKLKGNGYADFMPIYENNRCLPNEKPIYHVHGYVPRNNYIRSKPILSEKDYHELYKEAFHWTNVEQLHALNRNTCIFIGLSMQDPNLRRLLDISRGILEDNMRDNPHFLFLQKACSQKENENKEAYYSQYERIMHEFGITVIWYEEHNELPELLKKLLLPKKSLRSER